MTLGLIRKKSSFFKRSVEYCGYKIGNKGLEKCYGKVEAVMKAPEPKNITELRSFLGLVNFYGRFIPNLSTIAQPLHNLLKKGVKFIFGAKCKKSFEIIKREIASERVLVHYDDNKKLLLATDASPYGIGAVISHRMEDGTERPISFASRTLSETERKYSQVDREALAIVFGVTKFYAYLYGRKFTLITDHKPLVSIFHPNKELPHLSAMRMQHYAIYLQAFNYDIEYRKGNRNSNADALSRLPLHVDVPTEAGDADMFQIEQIKQLPVTGTQIGEETRKESEMNELWKHLRYGLPINSRIPFGGKTERFSIQDDCIFMGQRVYIPRTLRTKVLQELHEGHQNSFRCYFFFNNFERLFTLWSKYKFNSFL
jgi:hypothetical protein